MISVELSQKIERDLEADLLRRIEKGTMDGLKAIALMTQADAQRRVLKGPKTGRIYGRHQASAPGEAPANDTGFLAGSIRIDINQKWEVDLRALAPYAVHLEYGTRKMAPRPFLRPAAESVGKQAPKVFDEAIRAALR